MSVVIIMAIAARHPATAHGLRRFLL